MKIPEILAPAGSYEAFLGAVENGADAVYLGGKEFNARCFADNFTEDDIARAVDYAHVRARKVYITLNILLDNRELERAADYAFSLQRLGVDGVIVQDLGLAGVLARLLPTLKVHASTQMTIHNAAGVSTLQGLGVKRVVLARELSYAEVAGIHQKCSGMELEIFVHGALCFSYSGQCLMSSIVGGRSGNRGRCAQPCRLEYDLIQDDAVKEHGHLISPADLCLLHEIPRIVSSGVDSLKLEGRMKRAEYVATVTRIYRKSLDLYRENPAAWRVDDGDIADLAAVFNRNFTSNQWDGRSLEVLSPKRPNNRGTLVGRVVRHDFNGMAEIRLSETLRVGDGIEVWVTRGANPATTVDKILLDGEEVQEVTPGRTVNLPMPGRLGPGDRVFRTHDSRLVRLALESIRENRDENRVPVSIRIEAAEGQNLTIALTDDRGNRVEALSSSLAAAARTRALNEEEIWDKVNRIGNTPFKIISREIILQPGIMVPFSEINETRRAAFDKLLSKRLAAAHPPETGSDEYSRSKKLAFKQKTRSHKGYKPAISVRVSDAASGQAAVDAGADRVYLSVLGLTGVDQDPETIMELFQKARKQGASVYMEIPAILRDIDAFDWQDLDRYQAEGVLTGNLGTLTEARQLGYRVYGDYTLNPFNAWTVDILQELGAEGICLSPELNLDQLRTLMPLSILAEYIVHGQMPVMVSEHCVPGSLMNGKCQGRCDRKIRALKDNKGYVFPIANDRFCRLHLFNSRTTCLIEDLQHLIDIGLDLRIEALLDPPERIRKVVAVYREAVDKIIAGQSVRLVELKVDLEALAPSPLTKLHLYRGVI